MSGIVGVFRLDGQPVESDRLRGLLESLAHRGPDGLRTWSEGSLGLGQAMLCTTPESLHETQPLVDEAAGLVLVLDGRVDNRDALRAELEQAGEVPRDESDAELVLRAYAAWGEDAPARIIGDFAFALWDRSARRLFLARDPLAVKPLYYSHVPGRAFLFASELQTVLRHPDVSTEVNEGFAAELLVAEVTSVEETLYQAVQRLPPAHSLRVDTRSVRTRRYWDLDPQRELRYGTDEEYAEHLLEVLREAVRCRLRVHGGVGADLSGGIDSSSVCALAQELRGGDGLPVFSVYYADRPECDERRFAREVVAQWGLRPHWIEPEIPAIDHYRELAARYRDFPGYPNSGLPTKQSARAAGLRVLLGGVGGDEWFQGSSHGLADLVRRRPWAVLGEVGRLAASRGPRAALRDLFQYGLTPLLPSRVQRRAERRWLTRVRPRWSWLDPGWVRRTNLEQRVLPRFDWGRYGSFAQAGCWDGFPWGWYCLAREQEERLAAQVGLEARQPFLDRRVVELGLALPEVQRRRAGLTKVALRNALSRRLPEAVRSRRDKGNFSHTFRASLLAAGPGSLPLGSLLQTGWLVSEAVRTMYADWAGRGSGYLNWVLWDLLGVELWLESRR